MRVDHVFEEFKQKSGPEVINVRETVLPRNFDCLRALMNAYEDGCQ